MRLWPHMAILEAMVTTGIRELKDDLSKYVRRVTNGERIAVTSHGRIVAVLAPPGDPSRAHSRLGALIEAGVIQPPTMAGDPLPDLPDLRLPRGTAARLLDADREGS